MKTRNILTVVAAAAFALVSQGTFAQPAAGSTTSRAEVKADTKAAEKSGSLTPAGQGPGAMTSGNTGTSTKTRAQRKAETKSAAKSGQLTPAGEGPGAMSSGSTKGTSTKTRAQRKAETRAAAKSGELQPAGEAAQPVGDAPKK